MSDENWDEEDDSAPVSAPANDNFGGSFGMGRGFKPASKLGNDSSSGFGTQEDSRGEDRRPGGHVDNSFGKSRGFGDDNNNQDRFGSSKGFGDNDGGFKSSRGFGDKQNNDNGGGGFGDNRCGRGRGRGGGGFRDNDNNSGGGGGGFGGSRDFGNRNDNNSGGGGGGGFKSSRGFNDNEDNNSGGGGFGSSRGYGDNNEDGGERRGRGRGGGGGGRGRGRGGGGGYRDRDENGGGGGGGGYGGGGSRGYGSRDDGEDGGGGGFKSSRGFGGDNDGGFGSSKGFGNEDGGDSGGFGGGGGRGRGRGRGGGGRGRDRDGGGNGEEGEGDGSPKPARITYVPAQRPDDDETLFGSGVKAGINFCKYDAIEVKTSGEGCPEPIKTFEDANLRTLLNENIGKSGYTVPTPVQKYALPILLSDRDLMACAQTGSGKTAAYLIPIIHKLLAKSRDLSDMSSANAVEPRALIIVPTRELAIQISDEAKKFARRSILKCHEVYGGVAVSHQLRQIFSGCDILVGTSGRLLDIVGRGKIVFSAIEFVVLDEADRMLDMGFLSEVEKVLRHETMVPSGERQTLMFSATFPEEIQQLAAKFLNNYIFVSVGIVGSACTDIKQTFFEVKKPEKRTKLQELLELEVAQNTLEGILVFVSEKKTADFIAAFLSENSFPTTSIHGDRMQQEREEALHDFKSHKMSILVATAVAARGLDIKSVRHVINYDLPNTIDEYIHKIGRTGRVGNEGKATSFYDERYDSKLQSDLVRVLTQANQEVPDWLANGAGDAGDYGAPSAFGGQDIRRFSEAQSTNQGAAQPVDEDEVW